MPGNDEIYHEDISPCEFSSERLDGKKSIIIPWKEGIKEDKATIYFIFHCEFYGTWLIVKMKEEKVQLFLTMGPYETSVIHKPLPQIR